MNHQFPYQSDLLRRRGFFTMAPEFLRRNMDAAALFLAQMVVTDVVHNFNNQTMTYYACSWFFEPIDDSEAAREYEALFHTTPSGLTIEFARILTEKPTL